MSARTRVWARLVLGCVLLSASSVVAAAQARIAAYREPPHGACRFVQEQFGATPDPWQERGLIAVVNPKVKRLSLQACAGPGKTTFASWVGWYFLGTQCTPGEHPNGFATSITGDNLRDNLWKEFAKWQGRSEYLRTAFTWQSDRIFAKAHPATWFLAARNWPKSGNADEQGRTFSGLHGQNVLVLVDESGAIPPTVLRAAEQALPNTRFGKIVQSGNPISLEGMLHEAATKLRHQWTILTVTGDPDDPQAWVHNPRVATVAEGEQSPADWARDQIQTYGRDNPWVMSYILGQFPPASINALLELAEVEAAMQRQFTPDKYEWAQKRLGVDVARYGDDRTVLFPRQGLVAFRPVVMRHKRSDPVSVEIANRVMAAKAKWGSEIDFFDATGGWAAGAVDVLRSQGLSPIDVQFASKVTNHPRYYNRRAEIWCGMAEWVRRGALPNVQELVAELITPTYLFKDGKFLLEEKAFVKKRLGRSPDLADALALTFGLVDMPGDVRQAAVGGGDRRHATTEYDPYQRANE